MKTLLKIILMGIYLYLPSAFADMQTTTTITHAPASSPIINAPVPAQSTTTVTTVTRDNTIPTVEDDKILAEVYAKFSKAPALIGTNLKAACLNAVVTIYGTVTAQAQEDAAVEAAKSVAGVTNVISNINVTTNPDLNKPKSLVPNY